MKRFKVSAEKIIPSNLMYHFDHPLAGAVVTFEGRVRNHNDGKNVTSLEYQCYQSMAEKEGQKILDDTKANFDIIDAFCVHAEGHLAIGDIAVWIIVISKHRKAAYLANEYIINAVKSTVPIWKREHYRDFEPQWVACHQCAKGHNELTL